MLSAQARLKRRVLYVAGNGDGIECITGLLLGNQYEVQSAHSMTEALAALSDCPFDAYILDHWYLSLGAGIELCRAIRKADPNVPVFFYSSGAAAASNSDGLGAGALKYPCLSEGDFNLSTVMDFFVTVADRKCQRAMQEEVRALVEGIEELVNSVEETLRSVEATLAESRDLMLKARARVRFVEAGGTLSAFERLYRGALADARKACRNSPESPDERMV